MQPSATGIRIGKVKKCVKVNKRQPGPVAMSFCGISPLLEGLYFLDELLFRREHKLYGRKVGKIKQGQFFQGSYAARGVPLKDVYVGNLTHNACVWAQQSKPRQEGERLHMKGSGRAH